MQRNAPKNLPPPNPKIPNLETVRGRSGESDWQVSVRSGVAPSTVDWIDDKTQQHHLWVTFSPHAHVGLAVLPGGSYLSLSLNGHLSVEQWDNTAHGRRTRLTIRDYFYEDIDSDGTVDGMQDALGIRSIIVDRMIKSVSAIDWEKGIGDIKQNHYTFQNHKWLQGDTRKKPKTESPETSN